jgi:hypothetical protein
MSKNLSNAQLLALALKVDAENKALEAKIAAMEAKVKAVKASTSPSVPTKGIVEGFESGVRYAWGTTQVFTSEATVRGLSASHHAVDALGTVARYGFGAAGVGAKALVRGVDAIVDISNEASDALVPEAERATKAFFDSIGGAIDSLFGTPKK